MKERAASASQELYEQAFSLVNARREDWKKMWQDINFTKTFPRVARWIASEGKGQFLEEQRRSLSTLGLQTFMELPWNPAKGNLAIHGFVFTKDGSVIAASYLEKLNQKQTVTYESPLRLNLAFILLLGFSTNRQQTITVFSDASRAITSTKQRTLRDQMSQLFVINNLSRGWIKEDKLDSINGFEWDQEIPELMLNLPQLKIDAANKGKRAFLPYEMQFEVKKHYSKEVILVFLNHAIRYAEELGVSGKNKGFATFIKEVSDFLSEHHDGADQNLITIKQKLASLTELVY